MSAVTVDVPTLTIGRNDLQNLVRFIYKHEDLLKEYGALKLQPDANCVLGVKKRRKQIDTPACDAQTLRSNANGTVYSVRNSDAADDFILERPAVTDEAAFWWSLSNLDDCQRQLNTSLAPGKSFFYQRSYAKSFDIRRVPVQSLLKLSRKKILNQSAPCVKRAHGPGAIFPLSTAPQNLFSLDYHHEGGNHHWYVIPTRQRKDLQQVINKEDASRCLTHGQLFVAPALLDEHQIRYHRIVQRPNEFVVLFAGTLAQRYTEDASWSESIEFALPSWIQDGYATMKSTSCRCPASVKSSAHAIDTSLFRPNLIRKYIAAHLDNDTIKHSILPPGVDDVSAILLQTPNSLISEPINAEHLSPADLHMIDMLQQSELFSHLSPPVMVTPTSSICTSKDDDNRLSTSEAQVVYELLEQGNFPPAPCDMAQQTSTDEFAWDDPFGDQNGPAHEFLVSQTPFTSIFGDFTEEYNIDTNNISFDEIIDLLPTADECSKTPNSPAHPTHAPVKAVYSSHSSKKEKTLKRCIRERRTLFISGLHLDVHKRDLYRQFPGCVKVTVKRCRSAPSSKYAFAVYRSHSSAKRDLHRSIDWHRLGGSGCHVEFATSRSHFANVDESDKRRKLAVTRIPENVTEDDLRQVFGSCHIIKYSPARRVQRSNESTQTKSADKVLTGYAFILVETEDLAADTIRHADRYQIRGQRLSISTYRS